MEYKVVEYVEGIEIPHSIDFLDSYVFKSDWLTACLLTCLHYGNRRKESEFQIQNYYLAVLDQDGKVHGGALFNHVGCQLVTAEFFEFHHNKTKGGRNESHFNFSNGESEELTPV